MFLSNNFYVKLMFFSFVLFELWHSFSHSFHISSEIQTLISHILNYCMSFTILFTILVLSNTYISTTLIFILLIVIIIDLYVFVKIKGFYTILTGLSIISIILVSQYYKLSKLFQRMIPIILLLLLIISLLFINEALNCQKMLKLYNFPYHAIIEIIGLILFSLVGFIFLKWDSTI